MKPLSWITLFFAFVNGCSSRSDQLTLLPLTQQTTAPTFLGGSGEHDLWARGSFGAALDTIVHWDGSAFSEVIPADHLADLQEAYNGAVVSGITSAGPNALWILGGTGHGVFKLSADGTVEDHTAEFPADGGTRLIASNGTDTYVVVDDAATPGSTNLYGAKSGAFALVAALPGNPDALRVMPDGGVWVARATDTMHPDPALLRLDGTTWTEIATTGFAVDVFVKQAAFIAPDNILVVTTPCTDSLNPNVPPTAMVLQHYDGTTVTAETAGSGADCWQAGNDISHLGTIGTIPLANGAVGSLVIRYDESNGSEHIEGDLTMTVWDGTHVSGDVQLAHLFDDCYATLCTEPRLSAVLLDGTVVMTPQVAPLGLLVGKPHA